MDEVVLTFPEPPDESSKGSAGTPDWLNSLLASSVDEGPALMSSIAPFVKWLDGAHPKDVSADTMRKLIGHWDAHYGRSKTDLGLWGIRRLYAHLLREGVELDPEIMRVMMEGRQGNNLSAAEVQAAIDGRGPASPPPQLTQPANGSLSQSQGADLRLANEPEYWKKEFRQFERGKGSYTGQFNWAAFWFAPFWGLFRDCWVAFFVWAAVHLVVDLVTYGFGSLVIALPIMVLFGKRANYWRYESIVNGQQKFW